MSKVNWYMILHVQPWYGSPTDRTQSRMNVYALLSSTSTIAKTFKKDQYRSGKESPMMSLWI